MAFPIALKRAFMKNALIVIDIQNDYFPGGAFPLENAEQAGKAAVQAIEKARRDGWLVVNVQHVNPAGAAFFAKGSQGVEVQADIQQALGDAPLVIKHQADSFFETNLEALLKAAGVTDIYLAGMMTQHCITHTALSPQARGMAVHIVGQACAAPMQKLSDLALRGLSARCQVLSSMT
jgi:nicotinamidase-related amidase